MKHFSPPSADPAWPVPDPDSPTIWAARVCDRDIPQGTDLGALLLLLVVLGLALTGLWAVAFG